ncbi:hypothetical protein TFLX_05721 [Thermoflexales bacterium]|nr:hypothetical protein TFLX_05721 [Thermoflexales bacterium]
MKKVVLVSAAVVVVVMNAAAFGLIAQRHPPPLPTLAVLPTAADSPTPSATPSPTVTPSPPATSTVTYTPTLTQTATTTPTLATRLLVVTVVNAGVVLWTLPTALPEATSTPLPTVEVPFPPRQMTLAGDTQALGWRRYETNHPALNYVTGRWFSYRAARATEGLYAYSADREARLRFPFEGSGLRVRYVAYGLYGIFQIRIDGHLAAEIDAFSPYPAFLTTEVFGLTEGKHRVEILNTGRKNPASTGYLVAVDSLEVYRGLPTTPAATATASATLTFTPSPALAEVRLVAAPPTVQASVTSLPPRQITVSLVVAYDENGNKSVEPAEGVQGISVRLVTVGSNQVVASGFTNTDGFVRLEALSDTPLRLVVPYFGKFWNVAGGRGGEQTFSLLLPPGNQPGLIP